MQLEKTLTKENFWDEMMQLYPNATKDFCRWIDEYKEATGWNALFGEKVKFHYLPYEMQYGIWIEYCRQELHKYFEQPEHISQSVDLIEDVKTVFAEIDSLIDQDE